jgi:hypothetical protein
MRLILAISRHTPTPQCLVLTAVVGATERFLPFGVCVVGVLAQLLALPLILY